MDNSNSKYSYTGLRVLEVLKILLSSPASPNELLKKIEKENNIENVYTKEALSKYFNTLNMLGFSIGKEDGKYFIKTFPNLPIFDKTDVEALYKLKMFSTLVEGQSSKEYFNKFFKQIKTLIPQEHKPVSQNIITLEKSFKKELDKYSNLIQILDECCHSRQRIKIKYENISTKTTNDYLVEPINLELRKEGLFMIAYNPNLSEKQRFLISCIKDVSYNPQKSREAKTYTSVTFELKGRLKDSYKLYESEKRMEDESGKNRFIVSNTTEDRDFLMKRLIRYGNNCKILYPKSFQEKFVKFVENTLQNYEIMR